MKKIFAISVLLLVCGNAVSMIDNIECKKVRSPRNLVDFLQPRKFWDNPALVVPFLQDANDRLCEVLPRNVWLKRLEDENLDRYKEKNKIYNELEELTLEFFLERFDGLEKSGELSEGSKDGFLESIKGFEFPMLTCFEKYNFTAIDDGFVLVRRMLFANPYEQYKRPPKTN
ncbi:MAG: hypothetical protein LBI26_00610 [Holosporales bacterium]|jgi:hypothetical protein|nr:hypothetical protein [Holosporales bacterium]